MQRLRYSDVQASRIPASVGLGPTDAKLLQWTNEAQERLLNRGLFWGTYGKFKLAAYGNLITLPPNIAAIETMNVCGAPTEIHDLWFEFLQFGFGSRSSQAAGCCGASFWATPDAWACGLPEADYRGQFPTFRDLTITTDPLKLVWVCDSSADTTTTVTVTGYDASGNWIRTNPGGIWQDGETITLAQSPGTTSVNTFSRISNISFSAQRKGQCWLYESDTVTNALTLTGWYQWWETSPSYGRWLLPNIPQPATACTPPARWQQTWTDRELPLPPTSCNPVLVEIVGKLEYIPVQQSSDYLIIQSIPALKAAMQSIKKYEDGVSTSDFMEAEAFMNQAVELLDQQLDQYIGSGRRIGINVIGACGDGLPVQTFE